MYIYVHMYSPAVLSPLLIQWFSIHSSPLPLILSLDHHDTLYGNSGALRQLALPTHGCKPQLKTLSVHRTNHFLQPGVPHVETSAYIQVICICTLNNSVRVFSSV